MQPNICRLLLESLVNVFFLLLSAKFIWLWNLWFTGWGFLKFGFISGKCVLKLYSEEYWVPILMTSSTYLCRLPPSQLWIRFNLRVLVSLLKANMQKQQIWTNTLILQSKTSEAHWIMSFLHLHHRAWSAQPWASGFSVSSVFPLPLVFDFKVLTRTHCNVNR